MKRPTHNRAAQFSPFAALRGYEDYVADAQRTVTPRRELCEDEAQRLSDILVSLSTTSYVRVTHYVTDRYERTEGMVTEIDTVFRRLWVDGRAISFYDILDIEI